MYDLVVIHPRPRIVIFQVTTPLYWRYVLLSNLRDKMAALQLTKEWDGREDSLNRP
jgi:hypothetical protein